MKRAAIATLGCKVNQVESSSIAEQLSNLDYEIVGFRSPADLYIINTCTVTNRTDFKSRNLIRQALERKLKNPEVIIIVTGCYSQKERQEIVELGDIDLIVDNISKIDVKSWLDAKKYTIKDINSEPFMPWININEMHDRSRAFLKIQDGCDYFCSYCAVPMGRGKPRSLPFSKLQEQAETLIQNGYSELVLTGVNLGLYCDQTNRIKLHHVVEYLASIDEKILIRLSSIEPDLWSDDLLQKIAVHSNVCPHFHIPLQSGSDVILKNMGRRYSSETVVNLVHELNNLRQDCAIGFDMICGFPGETEGDYQQSLELVHNLDIAYMHVFGYSKRKGTEAATMHNPIHGIDISRRVKEMIAVAMHKTDEYITKLVKNQVELKGVVENQNNGVSTALSDHYIRIFQMEENLQKEEFMQGRGIKRYQDGILIM